MNKKPELLAPAGNMECLKAAVLAGCDAVYLAGSMFGARAFAGNFSNEELIDAINYCHLYGVKVYVTVNTIIYENEVDKFIEFVRFIHKNNVDAVLIQDLGMYDLLHKKFPNLELHASTQMHIHNYEGALFAKKLGFKRVVMARETSLDVIEKIKKNIDIEVECFIHGALCVSYSGQCLASTLIGPRSGNRGTCAQICRKKYSLYSNNKKVNSDEYLLSTKDLCTIENISKLIESNVDSLKIEGRMKRCEYVYLVTSIYRKAIDSYYENKKVIIEDKDIIELKKMFNRKFTKGFMFDEKNNNFVNQKRPNHRGILVGTVISKINNDLKIKLDDTISINDGLRILDEKEDKGLVVNNMYINKKLVKSANKGDIVSLKYNGFVKPNSKVYLTTSNNQISKIDNILKENTRKVLIDFYVEAKENNKLKIKVSDNKNVIELESSNVIKKAINTPITKQDLIKQISKTGNTIYKVNNISVNMDNNIFISIKEINELRRNVLDKLNEKRMYKIPFEEKEYSLELNDFSRENKKCILINNSNDYNKYKDDYDLIYVTNKDLIKNDNTIYKLPRVINKYEEFDKRVLVGELGSLYKYKKIDTDFSFNITNSYAVAFLHTIGVNKVTLSLELSIKQIKDIIDRYHKRYNKHPNVEVIVDSYPDAMITKFDLNKMYNIKDGILKDEYGNNYKLKSYDDYMIIKHYEKINNIPINEYYDIGVNSVRKNME